MAQGEGGRKCWAFGGCYHILQIGRGLMERRNRKIWV